MQQYISTPTRTSEILKQYNIRLKKSLGQNFLIDTNILKKIIKYADLSQNDTVLEIGSGIGTLTEFLLLQGNKVICVEKDKRIIKAFREIFSGFIGNRIELIEADAMKIDYSMLQKEFCISKSVSNLPYKISAPLILKILKQAPSIKKMYLTIQKDIADRIIAKKGDKNYSSYSVKTSFLAEFKSLFQIQRSSFTPAPFVDSVFLEATGKGSSEYFSFPGSEIEEFFKFIDACFIHRRKKIINSLAKSSCFNIIDKTDLIVKMLHGIGKDKNTRAEELDPGEFKKLFLYLKNIYAGI